MYTLCMILVILPVWPCDFLQSNWTDAAYVSGLRDMMIFVDRAKNSSEKIWSCSSVNNCYYCWAMCNQRRQFLLLSPCKIKIDSLHLRVFAMRMPGTETITDGVVLAVGHIPQLCRTKAKLPESLLAPLIGLSYTAWIDHTSNKNGIHTVLKSNFYFISPVPWYMAIIT